MYESGFPKSCYALREVWENSSEACYRVKCFYIHSLLHIFLYVSAAIFWGRTTHYRWWLQRKQFLIHTTDTLACIKICFIEVSIVMIFLCLVLYFLMHAYQCSRISIERCRNSVFFLSPVYSYPTKCGLLRLKTHPFFQQQHVHSQIISSAFPDHRNGLALAAFVRMAAWHKYCAKIWQSEEWYVKRQPFFCILVISAIHTLIPIPLVFSYFTHLVVSHYFLWCQWWRTTNISFYFWNGFCPVKPQTFFPQSHISKLDVLPLSLTAFHLIPVVQPSNSINGNLHI